MSFHDLPISPTHVRVLLAQPSNSWLFRMTTSVVRHVCDTIAVMHHGRLVELDPTEQVYDRPEHPYTRRLVAAVPTLRRALAGIGAVELACAVVAAGADSTDPEEDELP